MDRGGLVGNDGPTHMGLYDLAYMLAVPNMAVTAPKDGAEMLALLRLGAEQDVGPFSLRYPRDNVPTAVPALAEIPAIEFGSWEVLRQGSDLALLAVGTMVGPALEAARLLELEGFNASVVNCRFLKPHDEKVLAWVAERHGAIVTIEEGTIVNGFGSHIARVLEPLRRERPEIKLDILGIPDRLIEHATRQEQLEEVGLTPAAIAERARALTETTGVLAVRETA
jgi:1-deoxy-D-xylulose-5-phosphate synthase